MDGENEGGGAALRGAREKGQEKGRTTETRTTYIERGIKLGFNQLSASPEEFPGWRDHVRAELYEADVEPDLIEVHPDQVNTAVERGSPWSRRQSLSCYRESGSWEGQR